MPFDENEFLTTKFYSLTISLKFLLLRRTNKEGISSYKQQKM